ncbi:ABC transporter permease [Demequina lutea]|uniref:NitT/TauT family transport system permease protein n=1 Tax=Demequina lutea TaxID=431489 RepID=A0A7Y9Z9L7_9MICO|nr:ABC transporter permease [Demequina lutea]NYI41299.1 NitT/TauT family transport system permease protein [Demequina lutea]
MTALPALIRRTEDASTTAGRLEALNRIPRRSAQRRGGALFPAEPASWKIALTVIGIVVAVFVLWEVFADAGIISTFFWSKPSLIWAAFVTQMTAGTMLADLSFTALSTVYGFLIGVGGGVLIGLSFWWSSFYARTAEPIFIALEAMPKLALAPIIVLVLGLGIGSKMAMAASIVIVIQILNTHAAVRRVDRDEQTLLYSLGASRFQVFSKVVVPSTLPSIISSLRVSIGLSLTGAIVGEYIGSQHGLGKMIQVAGSTFDIASIWVGVFTLAIFAFVLYALLSLVERLLLRLVHG